MRVSLRELAEQARVPITRVAGDGSDRGDDRVAGKNGFLCLDHNRLQVVFTEDGRKRPLGSKQRFHAYRQLLPYITSLHQDGDTEFVAYIQPEGFAEALSVLVVKRFKRTKGVPRNPEHTVGLLGSR